MLRCQSPEYTRTVNLLHVSREYIFAEQYAATTREITFCMIATAAFTAMIGYLFLGRVVLVCILFLTVSILYGLWGALSCIV